MTDMAKTIVDYLHARYDYIDNINDWIKPGEFTFCFACGWYLIGQGYEHRYGIYKMPDTKICDKCLTGDIDKAQLKHEFLENRRLKIYKERKDILSFPKRFWLNDPKVMDPLRKYHKLSPIKILNPQEYKDNYYVNLLLNQRDPDVLNAVVRNALRHRNAWHLN